MVEVHMFRILLFSSFSLFFDLSTCSDIKKYPMLMPNIRPFKDDFYVCTPIKIVPEKNFYIVGFEPNATMNVVHHMLLFGCSSLPTFDEYWDCGEMADSDPKGQLQKATPCATGSHVIYAWARNAKPLKLPEDVGFLVGKDTPIKYLVLQIHYSKKFTDGQTDNSGLFLLYTQRPQSKLAAVLLLVAGGRIPPEEITHMDVECKITENKVLHPFAYRTHTHTLGRVVSGYRITRDEEEGKDHWHLLGKRDPLTPQMFYPVFDQTPIRPGDKIAARCTMDSSSRKRYTEVGPTNNDEMCNFYLMVYSEHGSPLETASCYDVGPPNYFWHNNADLNNIPELEASSLY